MQELVAMLGSKGADKALVASVKKHRRRLQTRRSVAEYRRKQASSKSTAETADAAVAGASKEHEAKSWKAEYDALVAEVLRIHSLGDGPSVHGALSSLAARLRSGAR